MKYIGSIILVLGLAGLSFGMYDFFSADLYEQPQYFWLNFVAIPMLFIGSLVLMPSFQRKMLKENGDILREQMKIVGEGLREGMTEEEHHCTNCGNKVKLADKFCSKCGSLNNNG